MTFYVVYDSNDDGSYKWIDSYWIKYEKAVARFKKIWPYSREPDDAEISYNVKAITTED